MISSESIDPRILNLAQLVLSPKTGILKKVLVLNSTGNSIRMVHPIGGLGDYGQLPGMGKISQPGGSDFELSGAFAKVIMEGVERYCGAYFHPQDAIYTKPVSDKFLFGSNLPMYSDSQYESEKWPFRRLTQDSQIFWTPCRSMITGDQFFYPSVLTYVPYTPVTQDEWIGPSTSTGMSSGFTRAEACLSGLLECVERESFAVTWLNKLSPPKLKPKPSDAIYKKIEYALADTGAEITFLNMTTDVGLPSVICVLKHVCEGMPSYAVGASTKMTLEHACEKSLCEAVSEYERLRVELEKRKGPWFAKDDFSDVTDWPWHGLFYTDPKQHKHLSYLLGSKIEQPLDQEINFYGTPQECLLYALKKVKNVVDDIFCIELTTREFAEMDVSVVKVIVPQLAQLNPHHIFPYLGNKRLFEAPVKMGVMKKPLSIKDLNEIPHPFS